MTYTCMGLCVPITQSLQARFLRWECLYSQCMQCYMGALLLCASCTLCFAGGKLVLGASLAICLLKAMI